MLAGNSPNFIIKPPHWAIDSHIANKNDHLRELNAWIGGLNAHLRELNAWIGGLNAQYGGLNIMYGDCSAVLSAINWLSSRIKTLGIWIRTICI